MSAMSDEDALLNAIAAHPEEDTPRLMYADWLDEHGQHIRAEFIRVQIEIAQKKEFPPAELNRYVEIYRRNQELMDNHRAELLGPLAALPAKTEMEFRRGFISSVQLSVVDFLAQAEILASARPRTDVCVFGVLRRLASFLKNPHTGCVTAIRGYSDEIDPEDPPYDDFDLLDDIERMERLEILDLEGCGINDLHCDLAFNFSVPSLHDLDLSNNAITDRGVYDLLRTDLPEHLTRLILGGNTITDAGAIELASRWPTGNADRLEHLNLRFTDIGPTGQRALLNRFGGRVALF
jgi:uncharacterized protein (TIGR02996 family)